MPIAGTVYKKKIDLKGYPEDVPAWVEVVTNPKADVREDLPDGASQTEIGYVIVSRLITDWNFTDAEQKKLDITPDNIKTCLSIFDIDQIGEAIGLGGNLNEAKKNS